MICVHYLPDVHPAECKNIEAKHGCGGHEHEKESVIPLSTEHFNLLGIWTARCHFTMKPSTVQSEKFKNITLIYFISRYPVR